VILKVSNHRTAEGEHFHCVLLMNESTAIHCIEEVKSHNQITPALAKRNVGGTCKLTMINTIALLVVVNETNEDNERSAEKQIESGRYSALRMDVIRKVRWDYAQPARLISRPLVRALTFGNTTASLSSITVPTSSPLIQHRGHNRYHQFIACWLKQKTMYG